MAPSHYQNQCRNIINWTFGNTLQWNLNRNLYIFIQENVFENLVWNMSAISSRPQCVNPYRALWCPDSRRQRAYRNIDYAGTEAFYHFWVNLESMNARILKHSRDFENTPGRCEWNITYICSKKSIIEKSRWNCVSAIICHRHLMIYLLADYEW